MIQKKSKYKVLPLLPALQLFQQSTQLLDLSEVVFVTLDQEGCLHISNMFETPYLQLKKKNNVRI